MRIFNNITVTGVIILMIITAVSCTETINKNGVTAPRTVNILPVANTAELADALKQQMNGIYYYPGDAGIPAQNPILNWNGNLLNIYTGSDNTTYALKGGIRNDSLIFYGSDVDGNSNITISAAFNSNDELVSSFAEGKISFACLLLSNSGKTIGKMDISFQKKLNVNMNNYTIIVHDGGGDANYSSNSLGGIRHGALTGANGMEVDVNISQDGIPFIFHDPEFKFDNINSDFCVGPVSSFTMEEIRLLTLLPDGSKVPTLDEALNTIVTTTNFKTVWLDIKNIVAIEPSIALINKYKNKAAALNRNIEIYIGLPNIEAVDQYKTLPFSSKPKILTELPPDIVQEINADAWGPQWDAGNASPAQISFVHSLGKEVFCWTIDDPAFFKQYTGSSNPDGIITNNPRKMIYEYLFQNN